MIHYMSADGIGSPWIANELRHVQLANIPFRLHALRKPAKLAHEAEWASKLNDNTLPIYPLGPLRFAASLMTAPLRFRGRYVSALCNALFGERENWRARLSVLSHFFVAAYWALQVRHEKIDLIHAQWIHSGGSVAMYGAWLLGVPFSFTGHAVDLFRQSAALGDKIKRAAFIVCISEFHRQFYIKNGSNPDKLIIVHCGIDLELFSPVERSEGDGVFTILSAGRLIEKKGFGFLIKACQLLKERGRGFKCIIGGSGPLENALCQQVDDADLGEYVVITGEALTQEGIPEFMSRGNVFCLACVWAKDNDVDGLPQLLMEAMACGLPAISTRLVGIPDLVIDQKTGLLVAPENAAALADTLEFAMDNPICLEPFVAEGNRHLKAQFDIRTCLTPLFENFRAYLR